jgi:hypothetical protein
VPRLPRSFFTKGSVDDCPIISSEFLIFFLPTQPTPPRNHVKHAPPSLPPPIFDPSSDRALAMSRRMAQFLGQGQASSRDAGSGQLTIPPLDPPSPDSYPSSSPSPSTQASSAGPPSDGHGRNGSIPKLVRGPWNHSGSISLKFDVETVLQPLKPAALSSSSSKRI